MSTHKIKYLIADDDIMYRSLTMQQLQLIPNLECIAECNNAIEASACLQEFSPDLLILDIEMPSLTGLQFAKSIKVLPLIIFISSHSHYAIDAFDVDAIDYLMKPVSPERLFRAIDKVRSLLDLKNSTPPNEGIKQSDQDSFFIKEKHVYTKINYSDILYIESLGDFVHIFLFNGMKKIALVNLKNLELQLPPSHFVRISRTHIVNKSKITSVESTILQLDKIQLPIGKTYSEYVMQRVIGKSFIKRHI